MQKLCSETRVPMCTSSTAEHAVPPPAGTAGLFPSYVSNCSYTKTPALIFTSQRRRKPATKDPAHRAKNCSQCLSARGAPTQRTGPRRATQDKLRGQRSREQPRSITSSAEWWSSTRQESAAARTNRLGEPQNKRLIEQHPLPHQTGKAVRNSESRALGHRSAHATAQQAQGRPKPAQTSVLLHAVTLHTNLTGLGKPGQGLQHELWLGEHTPWGVTLPLGPGAQAFTLTGCSQASCNPANRIKHQPVLTLLKLNRQFSFQHQEEFRSRKASDSIIQRCSPSFLKALSVAQTTAQQVCLKHTNTTDTEVIHSLGISLLARQGDL